MLYKYVKGVHSFSGGGGSLLFLFLCFGGIFNIPPTPFGYEMITANS